MTIDMLIKLLQAVRENSPLKGDTVAYVCIPDLEYQDIQTVAFITDGGSGGTISLGIANIPLPDSRMPTLNGYDPNDGLCNICRDPDYVAGTHPKYNGD